MKLIIIKVNGQEIDSMVVPEVVNSVEVLTPLRIPLPASKEEVKKVHDFVYECCQKCIGVISYNKTIIQKEDVKKVL